MLLVSLHHPVKKGSWEYGSSFSFSDQHGIQFNNVERLPGWVLSGLGPTRRTPSTIVSARHLTGLIVGGPPVLRM